MTAAPRRAAVRWWTVGACVALSAGLAGCGGTDPASGDSSGEGTPVTYLTSFSTFGRDAYAYVALEQGYFEEAGLDVTIEPGSGSVDVMKLIASGSADFGPADFAAAVVTIGNESLPVHAVAAIQQHSLAAIVSLESSGIASPQDLPGHTIGDQPGSTNQVIFPTYAEEAGIDPSAVEFVPSSPSALPQLLVSGQVDAIGQFVVGEPLITQAAQGEAVNVLPYGDVLPELYGNVLMASDEMIESDPELVMAFRDALLRGLEYSIEHPEETGEILRQHQLTQDAEVAAQEVEIMTPYVTGDATEIGALHREDVAAGIELMSEALETELAPEDVVAFELIEQSGS